VPRTATVRAITPVTLVSLAGPAFVDAVTGHQGAFGSTFQVIDGRLKNDASVKPV
jgi:CRP-like cAMP-binding protein